MFADDTNITVAADSLTELENKIKSTRSSSSGNYYISHSRLNQKNDSFSIMGAKIWNSIPENLGNSSKSLFKETVQTILLKIFEVQDRYADLNMIISDFKKY